MSQIEYVTRCIRVLIVTGCEGKLLTMGWRCLRCMDGVRIEMKKADEDGVNR